MSKKKTNKDDRHKNGKLANVKKNTAEDHGAQGRPKFRTGSTVQGGSDFGQGSAQLGNEAYRQGSEKNSGSNYENE